MADIQSCFKKLKSKLAERKYICTKFHSLRTSLAFHNSWGMFLLKFIHENPGPTFYQQVTQNILRHQLNHTYQLKNASATCTKDSISGAYEQSLTSIEENALRYFSGYVCYKIVNKLLKSKHLNKITLLLFMSDTNGFELDPERDTEMWTNIMDRGCLTHINETMYGLPNGN